MNRKPQILNLKPTMRKPQTLNPYTLNSPQRLGP